MCINKGLDTAEGGIQLISTVITKLLGVDCSVLMGANIAMDVAREDFCESTIGGWEAKLVEMHDRIGSYIHACIMKIYTPAPPLGSCNPEQGETLRQLFNRPNFRMSVVLDVSTVELCGALKVSTPCTPRPQKLVQYDENVLPTNFGMPLTATCTCQWHMCPIPWSEMVFASPCRILWPMQLDLSMDSSELIRSARVVSCTCQC